MTAQGVERLPEVARSVPVRAQSSAPPWAFPVLLLCLVIEFVRPQDLFRPLALVRCMSGRATAMPASGASR